MRRSYVLRCQRTRSQRRQQTFRSGSRNARLPSDIAATLTVGNVFDKDPSFYPGTVPYNTAYGSPLGRTFKFGVTKRF